MRRIVAFPCADCMLVGTLDAAAGATGILIVSGGNEVRVGAHRGMASLAQRLATADVPTFRFDRRGIGDSAGVNEGYAAAAPDIAAALAAFRREQPQITRVVGFGICDAATALALSGGALDAIVLANPWLGDENALPPPAAIRAHYLRRLRDPATWRALLRGDVWSRIRGLQHAVARLPEQPLARRFTAALAGRRATIVLAAGDRTAQVFRASVPLADGVRLETINTASHSFAGHLADLERILRAA